MHTGIKYLRKDNATPFVFIGYTGDDKGRFVEDNQALFDLLGEPFSADALSRYASQHDLDAIGAPCNVITCDTLDEEWRSLEDLDEEIATLTAALSTTHQQRHRLEKPTVYATDMPGGETYHQFIREFKARCQEKGVSTAGFTFHGRPGSNGLGVCHNDWDKTGEDKIRPDCKIFFAMKREPAYARLDLDYMHSCNLPEISEH